MSQTTFVPRPAQAQVLAYTGGYMGVSAVPGSGKTFTLSRLAAQLVSQDLQADQEVLVVTFANSAVDNFERRIASFMRQEHGLLPQIGYRVRTLHGLAHDIVRERPGLVGLAEDFSIVDERVSYQLRQDACMAWLRENPDALLPFAAPDLDEKGLRRILARNWPDQVLGLSEKFTSRAKDLQFSPAGLRVALGEALEVWPLLRMGLEIYETYQRALVYQGSVDFDDLIRLALTALQSDPDLLERLRYRWPYILEDEAQDSSYLQEQILRLLTAGGNWVRVGDPNQAINTTFTTANAAFLRQFLTQDGIESYNLPNSGRSTQRIINLANYLVDWACDEHPVAWLQKGPTAAFLRQHIEPTPPKDPQPNPADDGTLIVRLHNQGFAPDAELRAVVRSIARWLPEHPDETVAVLTPINNRGFKLAELLKAKDLPCEELLRSTARTRQAAGVLEAVIRFLAQPLSSTCLAHAFAHWNQISQDESQEKDETALTVEQETRSRLLKILRRCRQPEAYLYPGPGADWLVDLPLDDERLVERLLTFRRTARRWLQATHLPIDQLILTLAQELFSKPADLALAYKLALVLRSHAESYPHKRLPELVQELALIARNQRRFLGFDDADLGYQSKKGIITVATMHKAKGLEWDRVYLLGVNNYNFPSAQPHDYYMGEQFYVRDGLNLEAESIAQLEALQQKQLDSYVLGEASEKARVDYAAERLRLLYVGITRAKKELVITWNTGHPSFAEKTPSAPFIALHTYWED